LNAGEILSDFRDHQCTEGSISNKTVCGSSVAVNDEFFSLKAAVALLAPGSTLNLKPGYYTGSMSCGIVISVNHIRISSFSGLDDVIIDCANEDRHFIITADNVTLAGLRLTRGFSSGSEFCSSTNPRPSICSDGGSLLINGSSSVMIENCSIIGCSASERGGAISVLSGTAQLILRAVVIQFCSASSGGGIWTNSNVSLMYSSIESNTAVLDGGGIYGAMGATISLTDRVFVSKNYAGRNGSAVYVMSSLIYASNNVNISKNYAADAGTIFAQKKSTISLTSTVTMNDNVVLRYGAGMYLMLFSTLNLSGKVLFVNNYAANFNGGAIFALTSVQIFVSGDVLFKGNVAGGWGGSIHLESYSSLFATDNISFLDNVVSFFSGGAIYAVIHSQVVLDGGISLINNSARNYGGSIAVESDSLLYVQNNVSFKNNFAGYSGGAIYGNARVTMVLIGNISFYNNTGLTGGGGISITSGTTLKASKLISLENNSASIGGAIYASDSILILDEYIIIKRNRAQMHGGGIWLTAAKLNISRGASLDFNACGGFGGAVYAELLSSVLLEGTHVNGNTASSGGALALRYALFFWWFRKTGMQLPRL
jgi:predicted outer membrane repeat protein